MSECRISATYAATDGRMPESVEIIWDEAPPTADVVLVVEVLVTLPERVRAQ